MIIIQSNMGEQLAHKLTREDINTLKKADKIVFTHYGESKKGIGEITAIKKNNNDHFEQQYLIKTVSNILDFYGGFNKEYTALHYINYVKLDDEIKTLLEAIKVEDQIELLWLRDNNNKPLEDNNLHKDEFKIRITRKGKKKSKTFLFHMETAISYDNTGRMIREV